MGAAAGGRHGGYAGVGGGGNADDGQFVAAASQAWRRYDTDRSGYIEANELKVGCGHGAGWDGCPPPWGQTGTGTASEALSFQGFLSDLLKKANRPYDEPKLQEYTQTIVSGTSGLVPGAGQVPPGGVSPPHGRWEGGEEVAVGDQVLLVSRQLRMFDTNGDGKLGLSEMSR